MVPPKTGTRGTTKRLGLAGFDDLGIEDGGTLTARSGAVVIFDEIPGV